MKIFFLKLAILLLFVGITYALPSPKQDKKIVFSVSIQEADIILKALSELPLKESGSLYFSLQQQAQSQLQQPIQQPKPKQDSTKTKKQ